MATNTINFDECFREGVNGNQLPYLSIDLLETLYYLEPEQADQGRECSLLSRFYAHLLPNSAQQFHK